MNHYARCTFCCSDFSVAHGGKNDVVTHISTKRHKESGKAIAATESVSSFFRRDISSSTINAESLWIMFIAKHNMAFLSSDHTNKLFREMFPDSEIAKKFACGRTEATAIVKEALSPFYHMKAVNNFSNAFSILTDESNDKIDKSCIILVRVMDIVWWLRELTVFWRTKGSNFACIFLSTS